MGLRGARGVRAAAVSVATVSIAIAGALSAGAAVHTRTTPVPTYNAAAAKLVPASVKAKSQHGGLVEAFDATYAPDEFLASNHTTIIGFDADLGKAIAITLGLKFKPQNVTFANIIPRLQSGAVDVGNSSFTDSKVREKQLNFVDYFLAGEAFYVKHGSALKLSTLAALCGHSVAVENGTVEQTDAQAQNKKCPASKKITVVSYPTQTSANGAVASGHQEAGFADSQVAGYIVTKSNGLFKLAGSAINVHPYGIAVSKKTSFDKAIEAAINVLIKNGVYGSILKHWGVLAGAVKHAAINDSTL